MNVEGTTLKVLEGTALKMSRETLFLKLLSYQINSVEFILLCKPSYRTVELKSTESYVNTVFTYCVDAYRR